ncbi:MAG: DNRLRE domain-containing protein [Anaerolineales bacterium]|nr:DNRLRE domain-containing protein [Anaerolineales bacterium]
MNTQSFSIRKLTRSLALIALLIIFFAINFQASALIAFTPKSSPPTLVTALGSKETPEVVQLTNDVVPFTLSATAGKDTWVNQDLPNANYGLDADMTVGQVTGDVDQAMPLIWFDLTGLPADAVIISATLSLYAPNPPTQSFFAQPQALSSSWVENVVTWNTRPSRTSFFDPAIEIQDAGWTDFDVSRTVQAWVDQEVLNYGIALKPITGINAYQSFTTRSSETPPELAIAYTRRAILTPTADTWVGVAQPSTPHGAENTLITSSEIAAYQEAQALLDFDLSNLPENIQVISATLTLYSIPNLSLNETLVADIYANAILSTWNEATTTWNTRPSSYYLADSPTEYNVAGYTHANVTNIAQSWVDGSLAPYGILLRVDPASPSATYSFWSRELSNPPRLAIEYSPAPPVCYPITSVSVNGASGGLTGTVYSFAAVTFPVDADPPDAISWQVTGYPDALDGETVDLSWATPGEKSLQVTVSHCGGTTTTTHTITISEPPPTCPIPITAVALSGPTLVATGQSVDYTANTIPYNATDPVTFNWAATDQPPTTYTTDLNHSEESYLWNEAGYKTITVTAKNCGGTVTAYQGVNVVDPATLPDLLVSSVGVDHINQRINYVVHNQGSSTAPAGFYVAIKQGTNTMAVEPFPTSLRSGEIAVGMVDYIWSCAQTTATIEVLADWDDDVMESNETNNAWTDSWACDQQPPAFVLEPYITDETETAVTVRWSMNEACRAWVEYGTSPYSAGQTQDGSPDYQTTHAVRLSGLSAGATYYARAFCEDEAGLVANSAAVTFETEPPGSGPPTIRSLDVQPYPEGMYEFWQVMVELENDLLMERVTCQMDGTLLGTVYDADTSGPYPLYYVYLSPAQLGLTRDAFFGQHTFTCTAYRQDPTAHSAITENFTISGDSTSRLKLGIQDPHPHHKIYTSGTAVPGGYELDILLRAAAYEWDCTGSGFSDWPTVPPGLSAVDCDNLTPQAMDSVTLSIDGVLQENLTPAPGEYLHSVAPDIGGLLLGEHEIQVVATQGDTIIEASRTFIVEHGEANLEMSRTIRREENTFKITLEVQNLGSGPAYVMGIEDMLIGMQPILKQDTTAGGQSYEVRVTDNEFVNDNSGARRQTLYIDPDGYFFEIPPGDSLSIDFVVVPILLQYPRTPEIGGSYWHETKLIVWDAITGITAETFDLSNTLVNDPTYGMLPLENAVANAFYQADYVIVTYPARVYALLTDTTPDPNAERLFSNMAKLAALENGVLGFPYWSDVNTLDNLIEPDGWWAQALNPVFNEVDHGYVLLVGEMEIVASNYADSSNFATYAGIPDHVHDTDLFYANTRGETARPELVVGRVIGNSLSGLNTYLERIIGTFTGENWPFDNGYAYVTNGNGGGEWTFQDDAETVDDMLDNLFVESIWINFIGDGRDSQLAYHTALMPYRDLILYRGHGNVDQWDNGLLTSDLHNNLVTLGETTPVVFAAACKTGDYESGDDANIAEYFLKRGAGIYIGATEISERWANSDAFFWFLPQWVDGDSVGQALNQLKRKIWDWDGVFDHRKLWAFEYNLYGDPKYGRFSTVQTTATPPPADNTLLVEEAVNGLNLRIYLPELEINQVEHKDMPQIPGGGRLSELGSYPVPVWTLSVDIAAGQQVQDVQLTGRGNPTAFGNLDLPVVTVETDCACPTGKTTAPTTPAVDGWYPQQEQVYKWVVEEGANGSSTVYITLYPFNYNAATGDALYYRAFQFTVETMESAVSIDSLSAPSGVLNPQEVVDINLVVNAASSLREVVVQGRIQAWGTGEVLGGLPLQTLHNVGGITSVDLAWDTDGYTAGDYMIVVDLLNTFGQLLDTAVTEVHLGHSAAQLNAFAVNQEYFAPGDDLTFAMQIENTGTTTLDGTAVFLIQESPGLTTTQIFTATVTGFAPGAVTNKRATWDTTGATSNNYRVVGYFKFDSQITEPRELNLYRPRIFLPVVIAP